ncbi:GNAT family N-acetyltransferase [Rossellomorea aquimaris]|uniref:GNAT family N-acetyltransferase n=1 Tax=Rossellomorea aquimaris TaxID=189382 RepID=UPI001CD39292|nr:GNAT family protein [Rossellomorea aquimaris]MCA1056421.1 GNAT family N-acetyltransferase [Rossellomorea aquimaris]
MNQLLTGDALYLTGFMAGDEVQLMKWGRNERVQRALDAVPYRPKSTEDMKRWMGEQEQNGYRFAIRLKRDDCLIGYVELDGILWAHRVSGLSILIGEEYQGKGYGREAMECLMAFAFSELNLHRIQLTVFSYNDPAIRLYESLGFIKEGSFREFLQRDGKRHDMQLYGMLEEEWRNRTREG